MTNFTHHTPRLLSDADAAADLAGVPRPNDLPSVGTEDARRVSFDDAMAMQFKLTEIECDSLEEERECMAAAQMIVDLVSERDELASRVSELEAEVLDQCRLNGMGAERESALMGRVRELESAALAAQPGSVGEANTELIEHTRLLNEYVEACNAGNTKTQMKAADAARQKVEASALSLISAKARSEPDCAGGMPCTDCPDKRKCQAGCVKQEEALKRPDQKSAQRHPLDVQALYELQTVMADFGGDWPDVPGEQEVVRRAKMLSRLWKSESTTEVVGLNGRQRMLLAQAWTMLEDYAEGNRRAGNDSFADGAEASAHEIKLMLSAAPTAAEPTIEYKPGEWFDATTVDLMEAFYLSRLPAIREAAKEHGYAIGVHGSLRRDLDLIAMPWRDGASDADTLVEAIQKAACGITQSKYQWEQKPAGRVATSVPICWTHRHGVASDGHIDLSVLAARPSAPTAVEPDERAMFEAWVTGLGYRIRIWPDSGRYHPDSMHDKWEGWQARASKGTA